MMSGSGGADRWRSCPICLTPWWAALAVERLPDDIQDALRALPPDFRAALVLCDVVGLDYAEIAAALDIPPGTVRSRIHRARALLRKSLSA